MKPPNITLRLAAAFSLLAAVLVVVGWQGVRHLRQLNREMQEVIFNRRSEEQLVHEAFRLSDQNSRMMLSIFLRDDPDEIKRLLVQRAANSERISELLRAIEPRLDTAEEKRLLGAVRAARKPYVESYKRALAKLLDEHQRDEARKMMVEVTLPGIAVYHDAWDAFTQCQVDRIEQAIKQSKADFAAAQRRLLFLIILAALITSATAVYATRGVARATAERERAENALRLSRDQLEQRIEQRTAELAKSNQALQAEIIERQHTEEQLRAQTTALDAAANAIVIADHNGSIQSVNAAFTALTGYTAQEVVGHNPRLLKSGQHDEAFYLNLWQTISSGQVWSGELTNRRKDGSLYDEEMTITPLRNADGVIARYLAIKQDITKRKRVEEALRASQQIIEGIINAIPVRVFWKDKNLVYLGCNAAFARDAGFADPKDLIGKDDYQMGWRDQAEKYREDDRQVIQSGRSKLLIEEPQTTPDGNTITILTSKILLRDSAGKTSGMIGTYLDITERKRAEEELQRKTAFLEAQVNSSIDGILVVDQNRETSLQNQRFVDMFKMPRHLADA
jgi:PAS domain S-box-containing protein